MLSENPDITGAEVAKKLKVSQSYARTLIRRAKSRRETLAAAVPRPAVVAEKPAPVLVPTTEPAAPGSTAILARLEVAEEEIARLREHRPAPRGRWDISRRAEVLRRSSQANQPEGIAAALSIPRGEVSFILKVNQVLLTR